VRIIGRRKLDEFARRYANARKPLAHWEKAVRAASWKNLAELKGTFGSADLVDCKTVFNVGGNKFRLIGMVDFEAQTVLVANVMTHAEYSKQRWR
jgi:mRNA interferase HigB